MANARTFVPTLEDIGLLSDINMETIADTSSELIIYTARFRDSYNALSHELEVLYKRSRVLKKKKNQSIEKLFDERCKIFSEELQAHYRSVGESLVSGSGSTLVGEDGAVTTAQGAHLYGANGGSGGGAGSGARLAVHRQHVETSLESYSSEGSSLGHNSQEMLLGDEELPSYFQHEHEAEAEAASRHRRTFSLGSPAHSSSASSSLSLHSPMPMHTTDSPPDYVRDEQHAGPSYSATVMTASGSSVSGAAGEDEDAQFLAYHRRYDTHRRQGSNARTAATTTTTTTVAARSRSRANTANAMDMPPGYEETRFHSVVDPV
ncbi:hypothetical protein BC939DRAFT_309695 [Gamsiella multidivaricata]|uniref:uncharacterized protein n=1 Tax=Gamsiella multidivaricata TaxID=101098 RepID=UPI002221169E|nr:uncharacterized protein BC939DRAFT_309695 [Gamsiella multidivaricata]KAI7817966.1 hypothetical protein BC939DRAFT_309695 [Gamsiella multidivaricata]